MYGDDFIYVLGAVFSALLALFLGLIMEVLFTDWATTLSVFCIAFILGLWAFVWGGRGD